MRLIKKKLLKILLICTFIIIIVPLAILSCWSVEYFRKAEKWSLNNISTEHAKALTELNLTNKQKLKDFEYFYNLIAESVPMLNDYKTLYGIDFLSKKDYYHNLILKTKNDFEFYCVMYAICGDIPSCHTGFLFPDYYKNRYCYGYNYANVMDTKGFESATYYWYGTIKNTLKDYLYDGVLFNYVDGKYIYNENLSDISCSGKTLVSIDGISADEYIKNIISIHSLKYDFIKDKVYREYLFFNNTDGTPVDIILEDDYGNKEILNLYINFFSECADILSLNYSDQNNEISKDFVIYTDYKNNVEYISITNLDGEDGLELMKKIGNKNLSSIIVDIRNNNGGTYTYLKNYLYPILFSSDTEISTYQYFPLSKGNYRIYFDFVNFFTNAYSLVDFELPFDSNGYRYAYNKQTISFNSNSVYNRKVYILISDKTYSAADLFAFAAKQNNCTMLVGTNTGGEGLIPTMMLDVLPNSKLEFMYNPFKTYSLDCKDNFTFGTAPDIYAELSVSGFEKKQQLISEGIDPYTYENRLKWDDVLIKTLEIIKEKENAE